MTQCPVSHKRLGRQVKGFNENVWNEHCESIVKTGNMAKVCLRSPLCCTLQICLFVHPLMILFMFFTLLFSTILHIHFITFHFSSLKMNVWSDIYWLPETHCWWKLQLSISSGELDWVRQRRKWHRQHIGPERTCWGRFLPICESHCWRVKKWQSNAWLMTLYTQYLLDLQFAIDINFKSCSLKFDVE